MGNRTQPRLVVGVGASAGGIEAFKQLLSALPADGEMAFLLVQHLDPTHESLLAEQLAPWTEMAVRDADQGVEIEPNTVYVIRPDSALAVRRGKIELSAPALQRSARLPVDHLFHSLARDYGPRAAGIVLSGAASDGSTGVRDLKATGGLTIAQAPESSGQSGMPQSAIDTGAVDLVLQIADMPAALERFAALPRARGDGFGAAEEQSKPTRIDEDELGRLAAELEAQLAFDLRAYKPATIERRVLRRMALSGFHDIAAYFDHLRENPGERQRLVRDMLIRVTDFFRDPGAFQTLRELVIDPLVAQADTDSTLRAWVPGCATGEEAYSIAIEFLDAMETHENQVDLQIFATDIDQDALAFARAGVYAASIAEHVSEQRLRGYFEPLDDMGYQVRPLLRDAVSFAVHDLTKDPPFSRMNLVSCRNVLIYLTAETQKHILRVLHFALQPDGHLFLSTSESTGPQRELFTTISKTQRIYRKYGPSRTIAVARSRHRPVRDQEQSPGAVTAPADPRRPNSGDLVRRAVLEALVPPTIAVAADGSVLFSHGELSPYLRIPQGENPRLDLDAMLRPEIATRTRGVLYKCRRNGQPVVALSGPDESGRGRVRISARLAPALGEQAVILTFEAVATDDEAEPAPRRPESPGTDAVIEQLEAELMATREDLRYTVGELETSNEELRSSNERSISMNEELQSANEELEATTEELRSLNEELTTVNAQLREKIVQVEQANDDLHNFIASTKIATVFLDDRLCVKRFTPAAGELLGIDHADIGRCIVGMARDPLQNDLEREARTVLEHFSTSSRELHLGSGKWIARQVLPYRTESRRVEGVVVTFVDITEIKLASERLVRHERQQSVIAQAGMHALREADLPTFMSQVVREVQQALDTDFCKILELQPGHTRLLLRAGVGWNPGLVGSAFVATGPDSQAGYTLLVDAPVIVEDLAGEKRFSGPSLLTDHGVVSGLSCAIRDGDNHYGVIGAHTTSKRIFTREDASFLQAVASVLGSAIARHQTRLRLALEHSVAQALAESPTLDDGLVRVFECFAAEFGTSVGEAWWLVEDREHLVCRLRHVSSHGDAERVEQRFGGASFQPGQGLVGRVFADGAAAWCTDLGNPSVFARRDGARELGLRTGFGIPVRLGHSVVGVLAVFATERLFANQVFLRSLEGIGRSIGEFVARTETEQRSRRLAAITESSHDAILSYDDEWRITEWLAGAERLFGYTPADMIGGSIEQIVPEDRRDELRRIIARIRQGEVVEPFETVRVRKDGTPVEVSVRISPIKDDDGRIVGISASDRDVTRLKETERKLVQADRQKDKFIAMLGHELRNPLAAIRTASELLGMIDRDPSLLHRARAIIARQSAHMAKLLDGLLDISRIIRGKIQLEKGVVDFAAVCREVCSDVEERLAGRTLELRTDLPHEPVWIEGDHVRLTQIVDNLLSNAVKYTPDGGTIALSLTHGDGTAVLEVRDTGVGIEPELMPSIFDVFRQADQSLERSGGGLGLGLALVKSLVELHGGQVAATSEGSGNGAMFTVRLPMTRKARTNQGKRAAGPAGSARILLIEDNEDSAEMLRQVLELVGHRVSVSNDGHRGVETATVEQPDLVLCDIGLPGGMSGFDVARALRADDRTRDLHLVALTGYGRPEDKAHCHAAGFDDHLTKPVDLKAIQRILTRSAASSRPSETRET